MAGSKIPKNTKLVRPTGGVAVLSKGEHETKHWQNYHTKFAKI